MSAPARLIVFEGAEGVGKSTQLARLAERLGGPDHVVMVREPGGTPLGNEVRRLVLDVVTMDVVPRAEALLFMASRAQLVDRVIKPAMADGKWVLMDRYFLSTYAYQVAGRGLSEADVRQANGFATGGLVPGVTLLLSLPVGEGLDRADARGVRDRMERADDAFHARVTRAFESFVAPEWQAEHPECGPIVLVDASGSVEDVQARVASAVEGHFAL
ncbi:MAG: Thymidylate kinase [Gemmatimonadetes bacterium]|nr:Thymidylate kinase [Gemmatimonadota bacterium]